MNNAKPKVTIHPLPPDDPKKVPDPIDLGTLSAVSNEPEAKSIQAEMEDDKVYFTVNGHHIVIREPYALDFSQMEDWMRRQIDVTGELPSGTKCAIKLLSLCVLQFDSKVSPDGVSSAVSYKDLFLSLPKLSDLEVAVESLSLFPDSINDYFSRLSEASKSNADSGLPG